MNCSWCEAPATTRVLVEKAKYRKVNGLKVVARAERFALACQKHSDPKQRGPALDYTKQLRDAKAWSKAQEP